MNITVILCTYNRCGPLATALESLANLKLPESVQWEVLVVDNNSTDGTAAVIADFSKRCPGRFRYLFERQPGKSFALNSAIRKASGDIFAFVDDDVIVDCGWLQNLTANLYSNEWAAAGGRILPEQTFCPPPWLSLGSPYAKGPLVIFDHGNEAGELKEPPYGTNMAFKKRMFEKYDGFRCDLGPNPGTLIRGEDTEFGQRLLAAGERIRYEPSAIVYHSVPKERVQRKYFLTWWRDKAKSEIRERGPLATETRWSFCGVPLYLFRRLIVWTLRWLICLRPAHRFTNKIKVWVQIGAIVESYRQAKNAVKQTVGGRV